MESIPENPASTEGLRVFVIGGTGFIGTHIVQRLLANGVKVGVLTRNPDKARLQFSDWKDSPLLLCIDGDLNTLTEGALATLMQPFTALVFAAGIDERTEPTGDAWEFFQRANVDSVEKIFRAAQQAPITHAVLLSSIFLNVHRNHPELLLAERHPYIRSRVEQHQVSEALAQNHFVLTTLEIPWVFGITPQIESQWNSLITYVRSATPLLCCRGGVNVVAVQSVAEAAVGALTHPNASSSQAIGDLNLSYQQLVERLSRYARRRNLQVRLVNDHWFLKLMQAGGLFRRLFNIPAGLDIRYLPELLIRDIHVDTQESQRLLQYTIGIAEQAIHDTVAAAPENRALKGWRKFLNVFHNEKS